MVDQDIATRLNAALEGRYHTVRQLGEGGMATVYLAEDLRHGRQVALKVLRPELAVVVGAERFLAEIRTTANLQHPHILPLFDSGEAAGFLFYVMPHVSGESLREKLDREKQLPIDAAVGIATDVAEALEHAHRRGVIHRDIKPANILLQDGKPIVSDFGIALALGAAGAGRLTETGLSLGTPHYMSPEQATGDMSVGAATDVYALGCVLYEMLVGEPPFTGSTPQAILGKIIAGGLDSARDQRRSVPPNVDAAIRRALERVPADRFESAQAFAEALEDASFRHETLVGSSAWRGDSGRRSWTPAWAMTMTVVATLATAGLAWQLARDEPAAPVSRQYFSTEGWASSLGIGLHGALAPDGSSMVLPVESDVGGQQLGLKLRQSVAIEPIAGTDGAIKATYSPDGRSIVFVVGSALRKRSVLGGSTVTLAEDVALGGPGLAWLDDGTILYDQEAEAFEGSARVMQISAEDGSRLRSVLELAEIYHIEGLPGGRGALVIGCPAASCVGGVVGAYLVDLRQGASERILEGVDRVWYAPSGHLVYVRSGGSVLAAAFDLAEMSLTGPETPLFEGVRYISGEAEMLLGADGTLLYVGASLAARTTARRLVVVDLAGREQPIDLPPQDFASPIWSPDGESIAYRSGGQIYTYDVRRRTPPRQLTFEGDNGRPVFSPDGRTIAFSSTREDTRGPDIFLKDLTDDSPARSLGALEGAQYVTQWPSASLLLIENVAGSIGLWTVDLSDPGSARPAPYLTAETQLASMVLSPDGKLAAYRSSVSGTWEIRISSFPTPGEPTVVARSTLQAGWPSWSPDGAVLYYERQARIGDLRGVHMAARIQREPVTAVLASDSLFTTPLGYRAPTPGLGMHPAGDRWILLQDVLPGGADGTGSYRPILVENWFEELRERMGRE